ncbi:unnamed protein product [Anthophora plagiata]
MISGIVISHGYEAQDGKYPYQVSIRNAGSPICSGSIVNNYFILTAAQCIYKKFTSEITVIAGTNNILNTNVTYSAATLFWHENYNDLVGLNDIGLIRVDRYIEYNERVQPVKFYDTYFIPPGQNAVVTSWGRLSLNPSISLQEIQVSVIMQETCEELYLPVTKNNICTLTKINEGSCSANAGDPLTVNDEQIGIVSYSKPCTINYPDIYIRIYPYLDWIDNYTNSGIQVYPNIRSTMMFATSTIVLCLHSLM